MDVSRLLHAFPRVRHFRRFRFSVLGSILDHVLHTIQLESEQLLFHSSKYFGPILPIYWVVLRLAWNLMRLSHWHRCKPGVMFSEMAAFPIDAFAHNERRSADRRFEANLGEMSK